jgi:hypothetical protein
MMATGFDGDDFDGGRVFGIYAGLVVDNNDPEHLGRVRVRVPGLIEQASAWAYPRAGGSAQRGCDWVPSVDATVYVQFIGGRIEQPIWEPGPHSRGEAFPEHVDPLVGVFGDGPFRVIVDQRAGANTATLAVVLTNPSTKEEEQVVSITFDADTKSLSLYAMRALEVRAGGLVNIDTDGGDVQIRGRKVIPTQRPLN